MIKLMNSNNSHYLKAIKKEILIELKGGQSVPDYSKCGFEEYYS
jgi:hypothetical protein